VRIKPTSPLPAEKQISALVTTSGAELTSQFSTGVSPDDALPTLSTVSILDEQDGLVLGVDGEDTLGLAGFLARVAGEVVSAGPPDFVLQTTVGLDGCVDVTAVDFAGNESPAQRVCRSVDAGTVVPAQDAGAVPPQPRQGCTCSSPRGPGGFAAAYMLIAVLWRRRT
jgi:MYXO-CTERM domain-containing protein